MSRDLAVIFMGSKVDYEHAARIEEWLDRFGVAHETRIASAHKTPEKLFSILKELETREGNFVYIAVAGLSNALSGMADFATTRPVVSCPPPSEAFGGADIFSSLRMPPGVAACLILDPRNAALFAAKIFALGSPELRAKIAAFHAEQVERIEADDASLNRGCVARTRLEGGTL
ncbi:MAG: 5-(carboxyamino)imidazole ribonucleotide mutase [Spirochaetes bacterium]|nr:5-(carboxyamino)imidazole ribonucleotide mutase [Spirochaetota bacterium]